MGRPIPIGLNTALECASVEPALRRLVQERHGPGTELGEIRAEIVKRRVVRYVLEIRRPKSSAAIWRVIGKVYDSPEDAARGFHTHRWLRGQGFGRLASPSACIPEVYGHCPDSRALFMEEVGGQPLRKLLKAGRARVKDMQLFAEALAKLHLVTEPFGEPFTLEDHLARRCAGLVGTLARAFPEVAPDIEHILEIASRQPEEPFTLAHGDFHPGQVHVDGKRLWILDLDPLHQGASSYDVAMVIVMLGLLGIERAEERYFRSLGATFLERYFSQIDPARAQSIPIQAALILLKRACKRFRWQDEAGWEETVRDQVRCGAAFASLQQEMPKPREIEDVLELYARCPRVA